MNFIPKMNLIFLKIKVKYFLNMKKEKLKVLQLVAMILILLDMNNILMIL